MLVVNCSYCLNLNFFLELLSIEPTTAAASPTDGEAMLISVDMVIVQDVIMFKQTIFI